MKKNEWSTDDVREYYGKWLANDIEAKDAMDEVERRYCINSRTSYSRKMFYMRCYLKEQFGIDTPFMIGYRRAKI